MKEGNEENEEEADTKGVEEGGIEENGADAEGCEGGGMEKEDDGAGGGTTPTGADA